MRLNGQVFIKFNDFHLRFTDEDLFNLRCNLDPDSPIKQSFGSHGAGMKAAVSIPLETILNETKSTEKESEGVYRIQTIIEAEPGKSISGEMIANVVAKSKASGKPMAYYLKDTEHLTKIIVSPVDSVPNKEIRANPRRSVENEK